MVTFYHKALPAIRNFILSLGLEIHDEYRGQGFRRLTIIKPLKNTWMQLGHITLKERKFFSSRWVSCAHGEGYKALFEICSIELFIHCGLTMDSEMYNELLTETESRPLPRSYSHLKLLLEHIHVYDHEHHENIIHEGVQRRDALEKLHNVLLCNITNVYRAKKLCQSSHQ